MNNFLLSEGVWSKDPVKALPFTAISTSPYVIDECCSEDGKVYRSFFDNNIWPLVFILLVGNW
jgi:hypothetical protein